MTPELIAIIGVGIALSAILLFFLYRNEKRLRRTPKRR